MSTNRRRKTVETKAKPKRIEIKGTDGLRMVLVDTIHRVREGDMQASDAKAITGLSNSIIQSLKVDISAGRLIDGQSSHPPVKMIG